MKEGRVDIDQRHTSKCPNQGHKLVQITRTHYRDEPAQPRDGRPKGIFLPFRRPGLFPRSSITERARLDDARGWEQLNWRSDQDGYGVEELNAVDELAGLRVVGDDLHARLVAEGCIAESTNGCKDDGDDYHDDVKETRKLVGLCH